ncbi:MAG: 23S rRNA (pseudouridine(1915)-N(3))-methyltransferase RlmH [Deltaproteobacteria bacterium]|nr:23S rRNA (pseudouridine(1915)-N(3))-methyltransferase RlmH [Deltaproteobacteria bacterium]
MRLRIIAIGRDKRDPTCALASTYIERIAHYHAIELIELKEEPAKGSTPIDRVRAIEATRIREALGPSDHWVALDERGKDLRSEEVAQRLRALAESAVKVVSFVIGGPNGLDPALLSSARERWSLSKLTLPHRLARLVLAEQLYRACTILRGEPYHK